MVSKDSKKVLDKLLCEPYARLADYHMRLAKKSWLSWNTIWHYGVASGLCAAIDLINQLSKPPESK